MIPLISHHLPTQVAHAWRRSRMALPDRRLARPRQRWDDVEARERLAAHPLGQLRELLHDLLEPVAREHGLVLALSDARARILHVSGDPAVRSLARQLGLRPGADWSEGTMGANGPGTAAASGSPVEVIGPEHYAPSITALACWAVPVRDPAGAVIGVIDLSGPSARIAREQAGRGFELPLLRAAASALEAHLPDVEPDARGLWRRSPRAGLTRPRAPRRRLLTLGRDEAEWSGEGEDRLSMRHSEMSLLLAWHGGLSAEQLLAMLHERSGTTTAVRAEIRRLRGALETAAAPTVMSAPYRFAEDVIVDAREVVDLLDAGRVSEALGAYLGPVLPGSEAPGVQEIRHELSSRVRTAVLEAGGGPELLALARRAEHAGDHELWSQCYRVFAPGSPPRTEAAARLRRIEEEFGR